MAGIKIIGTGRYAPGTPVTNEDLSRVMETTSDWIKQRSGIEQRHFAAEGEGVSDLGAKAAEKALEAAGIDKSEIDYIIFATMTPEHVYPGSGGLCGAKLGIPGVPALDIRQQCAAMPFSLQVANGLVASGAAKTILIIGADAHAGLMPWVDWDVLRGESDREVSAENFARATRHRAVSVLFGDGAGAMIVQKNENAEGGFIDAELHTDGDRFDYIFIPGGGFTSFPYINEKVLEEETYFPQMRGRDLFKSAILELSSVIKSVCETNGVTMDDVDMFIAHQANDRINQGVANRLGLPAEKCPSNIARYGNTSAGTIGILLDELVRDGRVKEGDLICFAALGAGLNWGAALLRF